MQNNSKKLKKKLADEKIKIVSKIETKAGIENIEEIIKHTDEVMLGRGDMVMFSDINSFGISQEKIINVCKKAGKKIWVATDILNSMQDKKIPSRPEIIDIYNLKKLKADGVVLTYGLVRSNGIKNVVNFINEQKY